MTDLEALEAFNLAPIRPLKETLPVALIFTRMAAYVHQSTPAAASFCANLARTRGYRAIVSSDPSMLEGSTQSHFDVIVLVNLSGDAFDLGKETLSAHIRAGRGVLGVHACIASFLDGEDASGAKPLGATTTLIADIFGTHFVNHPPPQTATLKVDKSVIQAAFHGAFADSAAAALDSTYQWHDEFFNFDRPLPEDAAVLAHVDENSYDGGTMGADHPLVWARKIGDARVFFCGIGHFDYHYNDEDSAVAKFLEAGFNFVAPDPTKPGPDS